MTLPDDMHKAARVLATKPLERPLRCPSCRCSRVCLSVDIDNRVAGLAALYACSVCLSQFEALKELEVVNA